MDLLTPVGAPSHGRAPMVGLLLCVCAALSPPALSQDVSQETYAALFGEPAAVAEVGKLYVFAPQIIARTVTPVIEIWNKPAWLAYEPHEGWLIGEPTAADQGLHSGIKVCMTAGPVQSCLPEFSIQVNVAPVTAPEPAAAAPRTKMRLTWESPSENDDGTALADLAGFVVYSGPTQEQMAPIAALPSPALNYFDANWLQPGQHYFAVTAYNAFGIESEKTNVVMQRID